MKLLNTALLISLCMGAACAAPRNDEDPFSKKNIGNMKAMYAEQEDVFWMIFTWILLHDPELLDRQQWVRDRIVEGHEKGKIDMEKICRVHAGVDRD